ncbi:MAG: SEL1-like repeat protein [Pseudomonadota bacterium]
MPFAEFEIEFAPTEGLSAESDSEALYRAGLAYSLGEEVEMDLVEAHKWFNLAASRGHEAAKDLRQEMADQMSQDDIRLALKAAREWMRSMN